jgi:hypothetical protein
MLFNYPSDFLIKILYVMLLLFKLVADLFIFLFLNLNILDKLELFFIDNPSFNFLLGFSCLFSLYILLQDLNLNLHIHKLLGNFPDKQFLLLELGLKSD